MVLGVQRPSPLCISGLLRFSMGKGHEVKDNLNRQPLIVRNTLKLVEKGGSNNHHPYLFHNH